MKTIAELEHRFNVISTAPDADEAIKWARFRIATLEMQLDALRGTKRRLHTQLAGMRHELYGGECEFCEGRGYYGDADQPCPDCNPDGDPRDAP